MGRGGFEEVMTHLDTMTQVQRTPTIPMTKRESVASNGTRVTLLNKGGNQTSTAQRLDSKDFINTNPNMVAGKKRSPRATKKVKRTDSYKIALNRDSVHSTLDDSAINESSLNTNGHTSGLPRSEDRKKYNTLPRTIPYIETITVETKRHKRESDHSKKRSEFDRNASQRSGTCPSPDTDTDQQSVMTDRKKKSAFKRMKERLILTFKRDRDRENSSGDKKGTKKGPSRAQVKPKIRTHAKRGAFGTPSDTIEISDVKFEESSERTNDSSHRITYSGFERKTYLDEEGSNSDKKGGIFRSLRESMRRKSPKRGKSKSYVDRKWTPSQTSSSSQNQSSSSMERDTASIRDTRHTTAAQSHQITEGKSKSARNNARADIAVVEDSFTDANDSITGLFDSLIDPTRYVGRPRPAKSRPDTSKLRLDGLNKCKPKSPVHAQSPRFFARSSSLEVDGVDEADGVDDHLEFGQEEDLEYADVSQCEQQRRIDSVARCLAAIGDNIANRRESESAGSSMEDSQERSELEQGLLRDLRNFGDELDGTLFGPNSKIKFNVSTCIYPVLLNIIRAQDYSGFSTVVQQELSDTVGWEQVAWYTYLMKSAMCIASTGKAVGSVVRKRARRYFSSNLQPWIRTRPNGWESIHEETDIESELD